jgi:hypothetical protein
MANPLIKQSFATDYYDISTILNDDLSLLRERDGGGLEGSHGSRGCGCGCGCTGGVEAGVA